MAGLGYFISLCGQMRPVYLLSMLGWWGCIYLNITSQNNNKTGISDFVKIIENNTK